MSGGERGAPKFPLRLDAFDPKRAKAAPPALKPTLKPTPRPAPPPAASAPAPKLHPTAVAARAVLRPQRLVQNAHADASAGAARRSAPSGFGLDSAEMRQRMVQRLREGGAAEPSVLQAMATVPRHQFVDAALVAQAYEDTSLPIGHGQTISKPSVVARMIELLMGGANARHTRGLGRTLEIGTGCGYQAAVLSLLSRQVISIERLRPLHDKARELLAPLRSANLRLVYGDGMHGHPPNAPYDSIIAAAGGDALPTQWLDQLAVGGRLVSPMRQPGSERQLLMVVDRTEHGFTRNACEAVHFVPLKSGMVAG
ncbi:MAG TPA: protein-L-isoaspartate(D-aspartate) O-methyltransferase [Burkholderiaceae bacterium]